MPPVNDTQYNQPYVGSAPSYSSRTRRNILLKRVLAGLLVIILAIIALNIFLPNNSPDGVATRFVDDIAANKPTPAYNLASTSFQSEISATAWARTVASLSSAYSTKPKLTKAVTKVTKASLPIVVFTASGQGGNYKLEVFLQYSNNRWQVYYFNASQTG